MGVDVEAVCAQELPIQQTALVDVASILLLCTFSSVSNHALNSCSFTGHPERQF